MNLFPFMWAYGHHFRTENFDAGNIAQDYGVEVELDQSSRSSHRDQQLVRGTLGYVGKIQESLKWIFLLSNVLFLGASGGTPLIRIM